MTACIQSLFSFPCMTAKVKERERDGFQPRTVLTRSRRRVAAGLFLMPACAPLMASSFGNPFSALIRRGAVGRRLSCGRCWQRLPRSLPHLMYNYTDGETQVCLLSAIETLFTETCAHLHCCSISVCLFILSLLGSALEFTSNWISVVLRSYFPVK